ncbi:antitoxin Xre/MbcA/ParS toxin-binding domain-containing protein [Bosea sp. (in: a-proteobacteria)]|uniref:antitoxin Xre/MbcA/ParS toxin-binding domain-containing protein n=1 Tax=Bosea sp. (in: a-proteobacteria) TaxID=1871050 RepID=UPI0027355424|nr:antitoxin Xre/MbcA/ParS toxin-binding domain-containing protein [Bosea sp. (in: a-proteobacteria)]MDP3411039.1 DUF2384 domain-containing protein [Bosea sp. (in: a-proteobacteria)]
MAPAGAGGSWPRDDPGRAALKAHIQSAAAKAFGDQTKADLWLRRPLASLDGRTPLEVALDRGRSTIDRQDGRKDCLGRRRLIWIDVSTRGG